jgi:hypothetical protein
MTGQPTDAMGIRQDRPILGSGRGRIVVLAVAVGAVLPIALLNRFADVATAHWLDRHPGTVLDAWRWAAFAGRPLAWFAAAIIGFGIASGMNWPNAARWMGMLVLAVLWAGLADIAVTGEATGAATVGAACCTLGLWSSRSSPIWAGLALLACVGQVLAEGAKPSAALAGALLGALGPVVLEFCWHAAVPDAVPLRGVDWRT